MNIRDLSIINDNIKPNLIYRSSEISSISDLTLIKDYKIKNIIDFRNNYEKNLNDYSKLLPDNIRYISIPIEIDHAKKLYEGTPMESVYQYFALDCKEMYKMILKQIINIDGSILLSCRYGMDRTGVMIAIIHLICNTPIHKIIEDYLQTGLIIVKTHIEIFLNILNTQNGISEFFKNQLTNNEIELIRSKLLKS